MHDQQTRRRFLTNAIRTTAGAAVASAVPTVAAGSILVPRGSQAGAVRQGEIPFDVEWAEAFDEPIGNGLNGRVIRKLSTLTPDTLITPNEHFFVRTAEPAFLPPTDNWHIEVSGQGSDTSALSMASLLPRSEDQGVHLLECSGNPRRRSFGLMSACAWSGVPVADVLAMTEPARGTTQVLIGGFDRHDSRGGGVPGASWIFDPADLEAAGAFFATHMNGERLPPDHGYPVRLFIPGWYGCAAAKWVDRIEWVGRDAPATAQMKEYASRTGNDGIPELAREYRRGEMQFAAMPVRVEAWSDAAGPFYRLVGIAWGGKRRVEDLQIHCGEDAAWTPVEDFTHDNVQTWNLWSHTWRPASSGSFTIRLRVGDPSEPTDRLDRGYYDRTVTLPGA